MRAVVSVMLLLMSPAVVFGQPVVWDPADGGNGHTYQAFLCPGGVSWQTVHDAVTALGTDWHLATSTSAAENAFLYDLVDDDPGFWNCCLSGNSAGPWLGGFSSCNSCNDWQWVTGEPWSYTNWAPLEPFGNGDALGLFGYQTLMSPRWNDIGKTRTNPRGYILECPDSGICPELNLDLACGPVRAQTSSWGTVKVRY